MFVCDTQMLVLSWAGGPPVIVVAAPHVCSELLRERIEREAFWSLFNSQVVSLVLIFFGVMLKSLAVQANGSGATPFSSVLLFTYSKLTRILAGASTITRIALQIVSIVDQVLFRRQ